MKIHEQMQERQDNRERMCNVDAFHTCKGPVGRTTACGPAESLVSKPFLYESVRMRVQRKVTKGLLFKFSEETCRHCQGPCARSNLKHRQDLP